MSVEDFSKYYQKGGEYIIPIGIFNDLLGELEDLQQENKELSHIVANKVISDYDIDIPLKKELNVTRLKVVTLEDEVNRYAKEKEDLIKWLEDKIKECDKIIEILNEPFYIDEVKKEISINPIIPKVLAGNFLEVLDKVRENSNG